MKIIIGSDHGGVKLKGELTQYLEGQGHAVRNMGVDTEESVDYPDIARVSCAEFKKGSYDFGILICGTGIGISMAANKIKGIRCAPLFDLYTARMAKAHNKANFIAFGGRNTYAVPAPEMVRVFMETEFEGGRHDTRVRQLSSLEEGGEQRPPNEG